MAHRRRGCQEQGGVLSRSGNLTTALFWTSELVACRRQLLLLLLGLTLLRGLIYLVVFPPWQHYDEPTHFEYIRLIAERGRLPGPDDYDLAMRQEIAASMQAAGFWRDLGTPAIPFWSGNPPEIGLSELQHPPLYYALQALPQLLVAHQDVETQLYLARLGSILLNLVVVASAYGVLNEILPQRRWLPFSIATFVAFLPPFTDLMSGVNNDAGAAAGVSLLLWAALRLVRRGPSPGRIASIFLLVGLCAATKSTAGAVAVAILITLGMAYLVSSQRRWVGWVLPLLVLILLAASFTWGGHAAHWLSDLQPTVPNRVTDQAFLGRSAFALSSDGSRHPRRIFQELGLLDGQSLQGHTVTFGAWIKAPEGSEGTFVLSLDDGLSAKRYQAEATTDWQFHAFTTTVDIDAKGVAAYIFLPVGEDAAQQVYVDGLTLVDGEMPAGVPPQFEAAQATMAQWGTQRVSNLLKNGSAESVWPGLRTWIGSRHMYRQSISTVFYSLWDVSRTSWVYGAEIPILLQSFWGRFGWNHLALPPAYFYLLGFVTLLSIVGTGIGLARLWQSRHEREPWQGRAWSIMAVTLIVAWGAALLRVHPVFVTQSVFWPVARYAAVAIVPTSTLVCLGLAEIVPRRWIRGAAWLGLLGLIALDTISLWTVILPYYYG
jgi:hypothetical protein